MHAVNASWDSCFGKARFGTPLFHTAVPCRVPATVNGYKGSDCWMHQDDYPGAEDVQVLRFGLGIEVCRKGFLYLRHKGPLLREGHGLASSDCGVQEFPA